MAAKLTPKQQRFIDEYLVDLNGTKAAIRAGYSEKTARQMASENLSKPYIQEAVATAQQVRAGRVGVDQDWVLKNLVMLVERCMQHEPVTGAGGADIGMFTFNASVAQATLQTIGKHLGMFVDR